MKIADPFAASWTTLVHAMQTDSRLTPDEQSELTAMNVVQDAAGNTTLEQDLLVLKCLQKLMSDMPSFYNP